MTLPPVRVIAACVALATAAMSGAAQASDNVRVRLDSATRLDMDQARTDANDSASFVSAERIEGNPEDELHLIGDAEIRRGGTVLTADEITYVQSTDEVTAKGNAKITRQGASFSGPSMKFRITSRSGSMEDATWEYAPRNLRGCARNVRFLSGDRTTFEDVKVTTCKREDEAWFIRMNDLEIDEYDRSASGRGATLHFQGVPIFGSPWFSFPISSERRSGFLTPTYAMSSIRGVDISIPYYFNLAPNYDWTITPRYMTKRGLMIGNEARLMLPNFEGSASFNYLNDDREYGDTRWGTRVQGKYQRDQLGFTVDYNRVSDDDYISDFAGDIRESSEAVLPQDYALTWTDTHWSTALRVNKNQTLAIDPEDLDGRKIVKPFEREPQFVASGYYGDVQGFELTSVIEATRFTHPDMMDGSRFVVDQTVSYPMRGAGWFVIPKGRLIGTWYDLQHRGRNLQGTGSDAYVYYKDNNPSRVSPIFSLDTGLIFERDSSWFGRDAFQTVEPRIFYAYSPYRDQSDIPIFDTSIADLNFATLFTENVYAGYDRVSEANQVTTAISTRYIDKASGLEIFRAGLGQRHYFGDQRVDFLNTTTERDYFDGQDTLGTRTHDSRSDLLASVGARLTRAVTVSTTAQYSSSQSELQKINAGIRWQPRPMSSMALYYRYNKTAVATEDRIKQIDFAMQWPLTDRLYGLFRYNYSLYQDKPIEMIGGFEYHHDCWTMRIAAQRYTTSSNEDETNFFLQLELTGLGSIGVSPLSELRRSIKAYQTRDSIPGMSDPYDYYE